MKLDKIVKILLLLVAFGVWSNVLLLLARPAAARADTDSAVSDVADNIRKMAADIHNMTDDIHSLEYDVRMMRR